MFSNTKCLDDAENYCTFFRNKAKNAGRSRKNAVMQSNKATCGISRTIVGRLTPDVIDQSGIQHGNLPR